MQGRDDKTMKVAVYDSHAFEMDYLNRAAEGRGLQLTFLRTPLRPETLNLAEGHEAVCSFVNDRLDAEALVKLKSLGVRYIALRSAGFNHCDLEKAKSLNLRVARVPEYSPFAVAEHAVALILTLNRKIHKAYNRTRELNFNLDGLVGFDIHGSTVGCVGTGKIGRAFCRIMIGFGAKVLAHDLTPSEELTRLGVEYVPWEELLTRSRIISLHVPLNKSTKHLLNRESFSKMQKGAILVNTGRGGLVETKALLHALKNKTLGGAALDVYEEEEGVFFEDLSAQGLKDDDLARLLTFPNVLITSHQAFLTHEALSRIADTTAENLIYFKTNKVGPNEL